MSYYRLMAMWLADQAGGLRVPLPVPPPMEFSSMPEHFVEDMDDLLLYVARRAPRAFEGANLVRIQCISESTFCVEELGRFW